jgi:hypothetical protein
MSDRLELEAVARADAAEARAEAAESRARVLGSAEVRRALVEITHERNALKRALREIVTIAAAALEGKP